MAYQYPTQSNWQQGYQTQAAQPLPHGWEAKYNSQYKRYYFINHFTKETTWNDPRVAQQQQPQQQQAPSTTQQAPSAVRQATPQPAASHPLASTQPQAQVAPKHQENIPMSTMASSNPQPSTSAETQFSGESGHSGKSEQEKNKVKNKIKHEYDLPDMILAAALEAADYNEERTRDLLKTMGYSKKGEKKETQKPAAKAASKPKAKATGKTGKQTKAKAGKTTGSVESLDESRRSSTAFQLEDEKMTDFGAMYAKKSTAASSDEASFASVDMDSVPSLRSMTASPVAGSDIHVSVKSSLSGLMHASGTASPVKSSKDSAHLKDLMKEPASHRKKKAASPSTAKILLSRSKSATHLNASSLAHGPDFSLWKGPDASFLQTDMIPLRGSDPSLRHGPRKEFLNAERVRLMQRCSLAVGANKGLQTGPNASLLLKNG